MPLYSPTCLTLPGIATAYASAPDSAPLSITGDVDLRAYISPDFPGGLSVVQRVVEKFVSATAGYSLQLSTSGSSGRPSLQWVEGTTNKSSTCQVVVPFAAQVGYWLRATLDVDDGAGGRDIRFYTSADPPSVTSPAWALLDTQHVAATTSISDSTQVLTLGANNSGNAGLFFGKIFRAQVRNNIADDGTGIVFDADFTTVAKTSGRTPTTMVESSSNAATVTINGTQWDWFDGWAALQPVSLVDASDLTSYATASWTPRPNRLYLVWLQIGAATGAVSPTLSGNSMTWTLVGEAISATTLGCVLFAALSGSAPTAGALTADFAGITQNSCLIQIIEVDGADLSGSALAAVINVTTASVATQASPHSFSLTNIPAAGGRCFAGYVISNNEAITPRANWTELGDAGHATPNDRLETEWRSLASEQTVSASGWTGSPALRVVACEVREASLPRLAVVVPSRAVQRAANW